MWKNTNILWYLKMAWRDSRQQRGRLVLFVAAVLIGISAMVAIQSFGRSLQREVDSEAKSLLGADLLAESAVPFTTSVDSILQSLGGNQARMTSFVSMVYFPKGEHTRLAHIRGFDPGYPYYGQIVTEPASAANDFFNVNAALVEHTLMLQFNLNVGDTIKIGERRMPIGGKIMAAPGRADLASTVAPVVFIPHGIIEATGLIRPGSRVEYRRYFQFEDTEIAEDHYEALADYAEKESVSLETVASRKERLNAAFGRMTAFLNLVSFVALLLGCIGVASSVHVYIQGKRNFVATLRCLGATGMEALMVFLLQIGLVGFMASFIGVVIGNVLQLSMPKLLGTFIPFQAIDTYFSWSISLSGLAIGFVMSLMFSIIPLTGVLQISPLSAIRQAFESKVTPRWQWQILIYGLILAAVFGVVFLQTNSLLLSGIFCVAVLVSILVLWLCAKGMVWVLRKLLHPGIPYTIRQALSNLYRPNNQTLVLIISIGLSVALLSHLYIVRGLLLGQVQLADMDKATSNLILFDIQKSQVAGVQSLLVANEMPVQASLPVVTMRLEAINGKGKADVLQDTSSEIEHWVFDREFRATYRDTLSPSESIREGTWHGNMGKEKLYLSIAYPVYESTGAEVGDIMTFNVQGTLVEAEVSSIRDLNLRQMEPAFMLVFPNGFLEKAPQIFAFLSRSDEALQAANFQRAVVKDYPNVSIIDLKQILLTLKTILDKVSFVIRFMAGLSILTGLIILMAAIRMSKYQRVKESVLLKSIGANRRQIITIYLLEFGVLGVLACFLGVGISMVGSYLAATFYFEIPYTPDWWSIFSLFLGIVLAIMALGWWNIRPVLKRPPLEILRRV